MSDLKTKNYSDLELIVGHKNYYKSSKSGIIYYKDQLLGKFSTKETSIQKAKYAVEIRRQQALHGVDLSEAKRKIAKVTNPKIKDIWNEIVEQKKVESAYSTLQTYKKSWSHGFGEFFGDRNVDALTEVNLNKFRTWYLENKPTRHADKTVIHLKMLCRYCFAKKYLRELPDFTKLSTLPDIIEKNTQRQTGNRVYDEKTEVLPLLSASKEVSPNDYINTRTYLAVLLAVRCGLRKMEALKLQWDKVDFEKDQFTVRSTKNHKWRTIPMINSVKDAFLEQAKFSKNKSIFVFPMPSDPKKCLTPQILDKAWNVAKRKAGIIGRAKFHCLRRTCATRMGEAGVPPISACQLLDQSLAIYQKVYSIPSQKSLADMMKKIYEK